MNRLIIVVAWLMVTNAYGQGLFVSWSRFVPVPCDGGVAPYLVKQDFETPVTGYDHCETWTENGLGGTIDPAYTGVVLQGAQSLRVSNIVSNVRTKIQFAAQSEIWAYALFRPVTLDSGNQQIFWFRRVDDNGTTYARLNSSGTITIAQSGTATSIGAMSAGTTYHCWYHYKTGTGANAVVDFAFSTDGMRPTSGNNFVELTFQTSTSTTSQFDIAYDNGTPTSDLVYDKIRVDDAQIGDNPP